MKTFSFLTLTLLLSVTCTISHAQTPWDLSGNGSINETTNFVGTTDSQALRFRTDNTFRMGLTGADGFLGINTTAPAARFHMVDGAFVVSGTSGDNPNLGSGQRMMWIPERLAFRAGNAQFDEWDAPNVGTNSFAFGNGILVSSVGSAAFGDSHAVSGAESYAWGSNHTISGNSCYGFGDSNTLSGGLNFSMGGANFSSGNWNFALGKAINLQGDFNWALGCFIESTEPGNITLGTGIPGNNLLNHTENCLMVGFNSNLPTMFVGPSAGANTTGDVGIGTTTPDGKLGVRSVNTGQNVGIRVLVDNDLFMNSAILTHATGGTRGFGAQLRGDGSSWGYGALCQGNGEDRGIGVMGSTVTGTLSIGVAGLSYQTLNNGQSIGVYGEGNDYAAYFAGPIVTGGASLFSDGQLKTNVSDEIPGLEALQALAPKSYEFRHTEFPQMHLKEGVQFGFIAQDVQEVLPNLVHSAIKPAMHNAEGEIISEGLEHLVVDYNALIPILVKSVQEQQAMIAAQQEQIELLTSMVTDCCTNNDAKSISPNAPTHQGDGNHGFKLDVERPSLDQNMPNPFSHATRITFRLPQPTFARLKVVNASGHLINVLAEGQMSEGEYHVTWNGEHLAPGTYLYVLEANGIEIVKRAVKMH